MKLHLVDTNEDLVAAWRDAFRRHIEVEIISGDILGVARGALVSPANSQGHMDGGIDREYAAHFGPALQRLVYDAVARRAMGRIPVGGAEVVATGDGRVPFLIVAPTMEVPEPVPAAHCYRAMRAALRVAATLPSGVGDLYVPGLATGVGCVPEDEAAREMAAAYAAWCGEAGGQ